MVCLDKKSALLPVCITCTRQASLFRLMNILLKSMCVTVATGTGCYGCIIISERYNVLTLSLTHCLFLCFFVANRLENATDSQYKLCDIFKVPIHTIVVIVFLNCDRGHSPRWVRSTFQ